MCGIFGYIGNKSCTNIIYEGLKKLEYRGYDSSGIAVWSPQEEITQIIKAEGKLINLLSPLNNLDSQAQVGLGHTRWATHGKPSTDNAHPHNSDGIALIHNGIIENDKELRKDLVSRGVKFASQTDSEVVVHLIAQAIAEGLEPFEALKIIVQKLKGAFSLGILFPQQPDALWVVKQGSPMVIGHGTGESFFASDPSALVGLVKSVSYLDDGEITCLQKDSMTVWSFAGVKKTKIKKDLSWSAESIDRKGYDHFMLKEIFEQPSVLSKQIESVMDMTTWQDFWERTQLNPKTAKISRIVIVACGSAYYAGVLGKYFFEAQCAIPTQVELASEFRYHNLPLDSETLVMAISQSGETMDTLESIKYANARGALTYAICNVAHSSITRETTGVYLMESGPEIGVASTKAFTGMVLSQFILAKGLAGYRKDLPFLDTFDEASRLGLKSLPLHVDSILATSDRIKKIADGYVDSANFLFIGRGLSYPIALEGALKLKEISYIHAEGYAAGELKHGPIALIDPKMPVLAIIPEDRYFDKSYSNIEQILARRGHVLALTSAKHGSEHLQALEDICENVLTMPLLPDPGLQAIVTTIPLQLFAYFVALARGNDVDQPRNLAKSVTVE